MEDLSLMVMMIQQLLLMILRQQHQLLAHHRAIFEDHIVAALTLVRQAVDAGQCPAIPRAMADLISQPK